MIPRLVRTPTTDKVIEEVQDNLQTFSKALETNPILDGSYVPTHPDGTDIVLTTGVITPIAHQLGRTPIGFITMWTDTAHAAYLAGDYFDNLFAYMTCANAGNSTFRFYFF